MPRYERASAPVGSPENRDLIEAGFVAYTTANGKNYYQRRSAKTESAKAAGGKPDGFDLLVGAGYNTKAKIEAASDEELLAIKGFGPASLKKIRDASARTSG